MTKEVIQNDETKEPFIPLHGSRYAVSMRGGVKAKVALEAICEEMSMAGLSKKYGVHLLPATHAKHV